MRYIIFTLIIIINFVLTKDLFGQITLAGAIPNLNLLLVIIVAAESDRLDFLFVALIAGIITDVGFGLPIGSFALAYLFSGFLSHMLFHGPLSLSITWKNFAIATVAGVLVTYVWTVLFSKIVIALGILPFSLSFVELSHIIFFILLYNMIVAFPLFWIYTGVIGYTNKFNRKTAYLS